MIKDIHTLRRKEESEKQRIQERNINLLLCFLFIATIIISPFLDNIFKI